MLVVLVIACLAGPVHASSHELGQKLLQTHRLSSLPGSTSTSTSSLSSTFSSFEHPSFPAYGLRIKKADKFACDPTVNTYTGYLDVAMGSKSLFFWLFESRRDPAKDDVLMWINGGAVPSIRLPALSVATQN